MAKDGDLTGEVTKAEKPVLTVNKHHQLVHDAQADHHNALVGRLCTLLEAVLPNEKQCDAAKKAMKELVRSEQANFIKYCYTVAHEGVRFSYGRNYDNCYGMEVVPTK